MGSQLPRAHFEPKSGWFRCIERATSLFLSRQVWWRLPDRDSVPILEHTYRRRGGDPDRGSPAAFDRTTVLFLSDVTRGRSSPAVLAGAFARLGTLGADVVIHGGDLATSNLREILPHGLRSPP
jgi:hypothetical protein